jgi:hypothetical protein
VLPAVATNIPLNVWVQDNNDNATVCDNTITTCYSGISFLGTSAANAYVSDNSISKTANVAIQGYGTYTSQIVGATTNPNSTFSFGRSGNVINITLAADVSLTSNSTSKTFTNTLFPVAMYPSFAIRTITGVADNGSSTIVAGLVVLDTTGVITVYPNLSSGAWTASGGFIIKQFEITYTI